MTNKFTPRRDRPETLRTIAQRISTEKKEIYVRISVDADGDPMEVFVDTGNSGGYTNALCEALGKMISNSLRTGTDPKVLADDLIDIKDSTLGIDNGDDIYSIPDAVGVALRRVIYDLIDESAKTEEIENGGVDRGYVLDPLPLICTEVVDCGWRAEYDNEADVEPGDVCPECDSGMISTIDDCPPHCPQCGEVEDIDTDGSAHKCRSCEYEWGYPSGRGAENADISLDDQSGNGLFENDGKGDAP